MMTIINKQSSGLRLAGESGAPILNYNVPEPTTYSGRTYIEMDFADSNFLPSPSAGAALAAGLAAPQVARMMDASPAGPLDSLELMRRTRLSGERMTTRLAELTEEEVELEARHGRKLAIHRTMTGALSCSFLQEQPSALEQGGTQAYAALLPVDQLLPIDDGGLDDPPLDPEPVKLSVSFTAPAAEASLHGPHTGATVDIRGKASVIQGGGTISSVKVKIGSAPWRQAQLSGSDWLLAGAVITEQGAVTIQADADHSGGLNSYISSRKVNVTLDPAPDRTVPVVKIISPAAGAALAANNGPAANITVQGTASDDRGVQRVELQLDSSTPVLADTTNGYATWSKPLSVPPGIHAIKAYCYDAAGNKSETSLNVSVDATAPTIGITSPQDNAQVAGSYTQGAVIEVTGTAADAGGIKLVELSINDNPVYVPAVEKAPGDWSTWKASLKVDLPGLCVIRARATDHSGNTMQASTQVKVTIMPEVSSRKNRLILVETYRLSSFLADYGAGRTLKTFSLLPGEKSKISIRTYAQKEETMKSASTILDSVTDDIADEFEKSIGSETTNKTGYEESNEYKLEASMGVSWGGWLNASASASTSGATNAAREQLTKNIVSSTQKHVAKASARRDLQINTTSEVKNTSSEETSIVREIENINMSRTLNYVFRQMNQEFITLLHLVDVRVGFFRDEKIEGKPNNYYREVTLPELDSLLHEVVVEDKISDVKNAIMHQLMNIFDYQDRHHAFVEKEPFKDENGQTIPLSEYLRVKKDYTSEYKDEATGTSITVPGIIMAANHHVLRTDGVVVEAVLGQGEALDEYSSSLQAQSVRERELKNDMLQAEVRMKELALQILQSKDEAAAQLYALLNPQPTKEDEEEEQAVLTV
ncbi:Ig-like domain-containing protein [Paenibacillus sp. GCM10023252]|uniref:Ig-like domain-containing protein n=1 Tax=Paenibacillus sp. GCM10023252 TaxID=3252649 RepID=UPI00361BC83B